MLSEKSEIAFWRDESWVRSIACVFYLSGHFQFEVTEMQVRPASTQRCAFTGLWRSRGPVGWINWHSMTPPSACHHHSLLRWENWLNWGGGAEKSFSVRLLGSEPELEKGKHLGPALTAPQDHCSDLNAGASRCRTGASPPHRVHKTFQTNGDLKWGCHYLNLTF